jgi:Flp pilus assembly protein TadD
VKSIGDHDPDRFRPRRATQNKRKIWIVIEQSNPAIKSYALAVMAAVFLASCVPGANFAPADPLEAQAAVDRGMGLLAAKNYKAAKAELTKAQPFRTGDTRALMALAIAADMEGDFRLADRAYEQLLPRETNQAMLFNNMGYSYMLRGDLQKAAQYLKEAERRAPSNTTVKNNFAMLKKVSPL